MLISSLWDVKEHTHYSRRVGDEVPGVVAVLRECMGKVKSKVVHLYSALITNVSKALYND